LTLADKFFTINANFPSDPIAREVANITETTVIGTIDECQTILLAASSDDTKCGVNGATSEHGVVPINMW